MDTKRQMMRAPDAARYLGVAESTLAKLRMGRDGPSFMKLGRTVVYDRADLDAWLETRRIGAAPAAVL